MSTTTTQPVPVGSLWAFPCAEGCSPTYARVESVKGGSVHTKFFIVENGRTYPSRLGLMRLSDQFATEALRHHVHARFAEAFDRPDVARDHRARRDMLRRQSLTTLADAEAQS